MTGQKVAVYTCVAGGYEREIAPVRPREDLSFVCFTDAPGRLTAPGWEMRALKSPGRLVGGHDVNRYHKLFPHRLFPDHRWSIYQDGNLSFAGDHASLVARVSDGGAALGAFWHPDGHHMRREVEACKRMKFDRRDLDVIEAQLAAYAQEGIGPDTRIPTNYLLVRDHAHPALPMAMDI